MTIQADFVPSNLLNSTTGAIMAQPATLSPAATSKAPLLEVRDTVCVTVFVVVCFIVCKSSYDCLRQWRVRLNVVIVGSGPVGLTAALISAHSKRVAKITVFEEKNRAQLFARPQQIALDSRSIGFLKKLQVDFDNIEGCWQHERFYTRIGIFQEYLLSTLERLEADVKVKLGTKFTEDIASKLGSKQCRTLVVVADGVLGLSASHLGLSDEFILHSCQAFGAVCALERLDVPQFPTPETRVNRLKLDLSAFGSEYRLPELSQAAFDLKIYGTFRHRYLALTCQKCESNLLRQLRITTDPTIMRNIFQESFNTYRTKGERKVSDMEALNMRCTQRLSEIKLSTRRESVVYIQDENTIVVVEGDAARNLNFNLGFEVNVGFLGMECFDSFLDLLAAADTEERLLDALKFKSRWSQRINDEIVKFRMQEAMTMTKPKFKENKTNAFNKK